MKVKVYAESRDTAAAAEALLNSPAGQAAMLAADVAPPLLFESGPLDIGDTSGCEPCRRTGTNCFVEILRAAVKND